MNHVSISGHLTHDPEKINTSSGKVMAKARIAINHPKREEAEFFNVTAFDRSAEQLLELGKRGKMLVVSGRLRYSEWKDNESGEKRNGIDVIANQLFVAEKPAPGTRTPDEAAAEDSAEGVSKAEEEVAVF